MVKRGLSKTSKDIQKLSKKVVNTGLEETGREVEKLTEEIFTTLSKTTHPKKKHKNTLGQKAADWMTKWAGSWFFIIGFFVFLILWMALNAYYWGGYFAGEPFDPFPFILLNLVLSCLAAIQAPVILMSQNRGAQRDRLRAEYDYQVNRKAEKEIREVKILLNKVERRLKE
jgi:uncharacterized membrane protein